MYQLQLFVTIITTTEFWLKAKDLNQKLLRFSGMYDFPFDACAYIDADDAAFKQEFTVITNAKWSDALSISCDGKHPHAPGKYIELPWLFYVAHAKALGAADKILKAAHRDNVLRHEENFMKIGSASLTDTRPDYPLVFTTGDFERDRCR